MSSDACDKSKVIDVFESIFICVYCIEALAKILSLGFMNYFQTTWNKFDFCLIIIIVLENFFISQLKMLPISIIRGAASVAKVNINKYLNIILLFFFI